MRFFTRLAVVLVSAAAYGWAFPPEPQRWLAWLALAPLLIVLRRASSLGAAGYAWLWTVAMAYGVNDWFPRAVSGYFAQPAWVGIGLFVGVSTLTAGLQYVAFAFAYRRVAALGSVVAPFLAAAAWVAADLARLLFLGGDPWALAGYSQVGVTSLVQIADVTGVHGITFVVVAVNAALAEVWVGERRRAAGGLALAAAAVGVVVAYGAVRLAGAFVPGTSMDVAVVQAHLPLGSQWRPELYGRNLETYLRLSGDALRARPSLLVWPESAMTFFLADEPAHRRWIETVLAPANVPLIAGGPHTSPDDPDAYLNSAFLIAPDGEIRGRYDKQILLPFAESFPLGSVDLLRRNFGRVREFTPGGDAALLPTAVGPAGVVICNEGFFPGPAAARVRAGAAVLVNLANDSWLADAKFSEPAFDMVALRAVEQRRWLVRASTAGPSALIDPFGRVVARSALLQEAIVTGRIEGGTARTVYNRVGDLFAWLCVVTMAIACAAATGTRFSNADAGVDDAARAH